MRQSDQPDQPAAAAAAPAAVDEDDISQVVANSRRSTFSVFCHVQLCLCPEPNLWFCLCLCLVHYYSDDHSFSHLSRLVKPVSKSVRASVHASVQCQHLKTPKAPRPLGRDR